jgi:hypothetical protein
MALLQVAAAASAASLHYQLFLDSFKGDDGQLPAKVEPEMEQHYLSAAFCMARVLQAGAVQHKEPRWASCWEFTNCVLFGLGSSLQPMLHVTCMLLWVSGRRHGWRRVHVQLPDA